MCVLRRSSRAVNTVRRETLPQLLSRCEGACQSQEESFPKLIFIIQRSSPSAPQCLLATTPDLPLPHPGTESLTSNLHLAALLASRRSGRSSQMERFGAERAGRTRLLSFPVASSSRLWLGREHFRPGRSQYGMKVRLASSLHKANVSC